MIFIALIIQYIIFFSTNLLLLDIAKFAINPKQDVNEFFLFTEIFDSFCTISFKKICIELHIPNRINLLRLLSKSEILDNAPNVVLSTLLSCKYLCKFSNN